MSTPLAFTYQTSDGTKIFAKKWVSEKKPKAVVQIAHGYAEHIMRYEAFAEYLLKQNIFVYGNDHRGHGETAKSSANYLYFADESGFDEVVKDMRTLTKMIKEDYPGTPVILFGHSMGSFLTRRYIELFGFELSSVVLCGTGWFSGLPVKIAKWIAAAGVKKNGRKSPSPLLTYLVFGTLNKRFKPNRTYMDWLTRDEQAVDKFFEDPSLRIVATFGFFHDYLHSLDKVNQIRSIKPVPTDLPILIISGSHDPVGGAKEKGVFKTFHSFKKAGVQNVQLKLYEEARHELLNEINKDEIQQDIVKWINSCVQN